MKTDGLQVEEFELENTIKSKPNLLRKIHNFVSLCSIIS